MTLKKIIFLILLLLIESNICLAEEEYEIKYKWYKEEIEGDYFMKGMAPSIYEYCDKNNFIYSDYISDFKLLDGSVNLNDTTKEYELKTIYSYKIPLKINYINLGGFTGVLDIEKVNIYYKDILLSYNTANYYGTDWDGFKGNFGEYSFISFSLGNYYDSKDIYVEIITKPTKEIINYELRYAIGFNDNYDENVIKYKVSNQNIKYIPNNDWDILRLDNKIYEGSEEDLKDNLYIIENIMVYYRYRNKLLYYYKINKIYYDDNYYSNLDGYLPDYNNYKIYNNCDDVDNNKVITIENNTENTTDITKTYSKDISSISNTSTVNNLIRTSDTNKYLIVASIIISLTIMGIGLINIGCKNCRTN